MYMYIHICIYIYIHIYIYTYMYIRICIYRHTYRKVDTLILRCLRIYAMSELGVGLLWLSVTLGRLTVPRNAILKITIHNVKLQHIRSSICAYTTSIRYGLVLTQRDTGWFRFDFAISKNCNILQRTAMHCNALQCTATHCNILTAWYIFMC